jgi:hypothetical protein
LSESDGTIRRYATGGLLVDPDALSHPERFTVGQIAWAEAMAVALLQGTMQHYEWLRSECGTLHGENYPQVMEDVSNALEAELIHEPIIANIAAIGTLLFSYHPNTSSSASPAAYKKLASILEILRAWLGKCKSLGTLLSGSHGQERERDYTLH